MKALWLVALALAAQTAHAEGSLSTTVPSPAGSVAQGTLSAGDVPVSYKFNGLLQAWTVNDSQASATNRLNFRLRRAELKLSGTAGASARYFVMIDPAKTIHPDSNRPQDGKVLQDLGVGFMVLPGLEVMAGQFKTPTSAEGLGSSAELLIPERSATARYFGDSRDTGVQVTYQGTGFKTTVMASNGQGTNLPSASTNKDLTARLDAVPVKGLNTGIYGSIGDFNYNRKGSWGVNARYALTRELTAGVEYDQGRRNNQFVEGVVFDVAYLVTPELQPVLRHEFLRVAGISATAQQTALGVNYLVLKNTAKIQAAMSVLTNMVGGIDGSPAVTLGAHGPQATVSFQASI